MSDRAVCYRRVLPLLGMLLFCGVGSVAAKGTAVGINGHYRAGHWTAVRMQGEVHDAVIETTDGDGAAVIYEQSFLQPRPDSDAPVFAYCVPGTEAAPLIVRPRAAEAEGVKTVYLQTRFPERGVPAEGPAMIATEMTWVVVFGDPLGIQTIGANELLGRDASIAVTRVTQADRIPDHVLGLSGVDMILITGSGAEVLRNLSPSQAKAMADWVRRGGRMLVTLGATAESTLAAAPWLVELLPESVSQSSVVRMDPSGLETFTTSQTRLAGFDGWQLPRTIGAGGISLSSVGEVLISGRTARRIGLPLAARYTVGLGKITVLSADLDAEPFVDWSERLELVKKLTGDQLSEHRNEQSGSFRVSGYADLAGQVRRSLDQFPIKRHFSFSIIALIIAALLALVAPVDYLLVRRVLGNPLLGWMTFPLIAATLSVALVFAAKPRLDTELTATSPAATSPAATSPAAKVSSTPIAAAGGSSVEMDQMQANSIELLDLDSVTQTGRLFRWSFLYSHPAQSVRLVPQRSDALASIVERTSYQMLAPFGAPGQSLGGIQIDSWSDPLHVPIGRSHLPPAARATAGDAAEDPGDHRSEVEGYLASHIETLELAPRSSKSVALQMQFTSSVDAAPMQRRSGAELLQGPLANPLDIDLLDSMLVYQNLVYLLPTRFPAGQTVKEIDSLRQKNFRWHLSRQRALESSSQAEAWGVTRTDQTERLAEMLMFHDVVGGGRYTGLQNEVLGHLDLTDLLTPDQCILVGRCAQPWVTFGVGQSSDAAALSVPRGDNQSWVRVLIPVVEVRR